MKAGLIMAFIVLASLVLVPSVGAIMDDTGDLSPHIDMDKHGGFGLGKVGTAVANWLSTGIKNRIRWR